MYSGEEAAQIMNLWGGERKPFLFVIDYEMEAIRLFPLDNPLPENVAFSFSNGHSTTCLNNDDRKFGILKYPVSFENYCEAFHQVQKNIHAGNSFLVNLTFPTPIEMPFTLREIFQMANARYKLLIDPEFVVFSPETFITIEEGSISSYPMKGTIDASIPGAGDIILNDPKETAEHHTIVDLIRNDLSRVASDVTVEKFRYIETILTHQGKLLQVSSKITAKLPENFHHHLGDILFSMLPAGSISGAPKAQTLRIIENAESDKRGYYTGIFGKFDGHNLQSAVMIRFIENKNEKMYFRSGGGITALSNARNEYNELIEKIYVPIGGVCQSHL